MSVLWASAALFGVLAGMSLVAGLVARRPLGPVGLGLCSMSCLLAAWSSAGLATRHGTMTPALLALAFAAAGSLAGYRLAASVVLSMAARPPAHQPVRHSGAERLAVILADAEPRVYDPYPIAARLARIERSGAAALSPGMLPLVFFAERVRYRALRAQHPAQYVVDALAEAVRDRLGRSHRTLDVAVAYVDCTPDLPSVITASSADSLLIVELGAAGSLPYVEARSSAERIAFPRRLVRNVEPSIWRDARLASRLVERILDRVPTDERTSTGIVLLGSGIPSAWHPQSGPWIEDETYFLTRVALFLEESGVPPHAIRPAWMDWQSPNLAEALRHAAAIGSNRIVVCPATILYPDLMTLLDTGREIRDARLPEHVQVTILPPWGDDQVLVEVLTSRIAEAFGLEQDIG